MDRTMIIASCSATREEQDKRRQEDNNTRSQARSQSSGVRPVSVQGWSVWPEDKRRTKGGQLQDKRRTTGGQDPATEPSHRVQGQGQSVWPCGQPFF